MISSAKQEILHQLQRDILTLQGSRPPATSQIDLGLGPITAAFADRVFPTAAIHELVSMTPEHTPSTNGFTAALVSGLMRQGGACVWISAARRIYPPGLLAFGIQPDKVVFLQMRTTTEVLWATEEALKCPGLAAVVSDIRDLSMTVSRRLQLAVETSRTTGFILRCQPRLLVPTASVARWQITPLPSEVDADLPGIGFPRWQIELTRIRNGKPGSWETQWRAGHFRFTRPAVHVLAAARQKRAG